MNTQSRKKSHELSGTKRKKVSLYSILKRKLYNGNLDTVTFVKEDNVVIRQPINDFFLRTQNNRFKNAKEILTDLNAIKHDLKAKRIII